jgi:hypothetical protein
MSRTDESIVDYFPAEKQKYILKHERIDSLFFLIKKTRRYALCDLV